MATYRHDIARHAGLLARALRRAGEGGAAPQSDRAPLRVLLGDLARACGALADQCWSRRERSGALYWRTAAVYAGHIRRAIQPHRDTPHQLSLLKDAA